MGTVDVEENFIGTRWSKLLINASFSGMSAVLGCTFGEAAGPKESRRIVQALIKECIDVCARGGIRIEPVQGKDIVRKLRKRDKVGKTFAKFAVLQTISVLISNNQKVFFVFRKSALHFHCKNSNQS